MSKGDFEFGLIFAVSLEFRIYRDTLPLNLEIALFKPRTFRIWNPGPANVFNETIYSTFVKQ